METRYDTCDVCAADETCAVVGAAKICGDCGNEIADRTGSEGGVLRLARKERDSAQKAAEDMRDDLADARTDRDAWKARALDAERLHAEQEKISSELEDRNERLRKFLLEADRERFEAHHAKVPA